MAPSTRPLTLAAIGGATALAMTFGATPALAHGDPGHGGPHHETLAQAKKHAEHGLKFGVKVLDRFESIAAEDSYVGSTARHKALTLAEKQVARDKRAEVKVHHATSIEQVEHAVESARAPHPRTPDHHPDHHPTLHQQKNGAQLMLDGSAALVEQSRVHAQNHPKQPHPNFAKELRAIAKTKKKVDDARNEKQLEAVLHPHHGPGGHGGHGGHGPGHGPRNA